ncbi:MAG: ATP-binding protein [Marinilabiliales bacterium]|nr:MAG: ATP-binding protein [Marinilabiliales bacterium]
MSDIYQERMSAAIFNWSTGKDSAMALHKFLNEERMPLKFLLTSVSEKYFRVSMHGIKESLLDQQVECIGLELKKVYIPENASNETYEKVMFDFFSKHAGNITHSVFGDINLEDLRVYREKQLDKLDIKAVFPLWEINTAELAKNFIDQGFKALVVSVDASKLPKEACGKLFDQQFLNSLPEGVDPCGENGEFHTFVFDGPVFRYPVKFTKREIVYKEYETPASTFGFWYCDLDN